MQNNVYRFVIHVICNENRFVIIEIVIEIVVSVVVVIIEIVIEIVVVINTK